MKQFIFILSVLILASCSQNTPEPTGTFGSSDGGHFDSITTPKGNASELEIKPFSNPALIYGSDFGNYFQSMYERGQFEEMLAFTSSESIELHGKENILNHYKNMDFGFELGKLKSKTETENYNKGHYITTLNYNANIDATKVVFRLNVVVENDSCKIVLPNNLKDFNS